MLFATSLIQIKIIHRFKFILNIQCAWVKKKEETNETIFNFGFYSLTDNIKNKAHNFIVPSRRLAPNWWPAPVLREYDLS